MFITWILFFDAENLVSQFKIITKLENLENEQMYYLQKIKEVKKDKKKFLNDKELLEQFAREKYYMKKEKEDLYICVK